MFASHSYYPAEISILTEQNLCTISTRSHWRENVFDDEMMTGFLSATYQPISLMTIESFKDLGYTVDDSAADDFTAAQVNLANIPRDSNGQGFAPPANSEPISLEAILGIIVGGVLVLLVITTLYMRSRSSRGRTLNTPSPFSSVPPNALPVGSATIPGRGVGLPTAVPVAGADGNAIPAVLVDVRTLLQDPVWQVSAFEFQEITNVTDLNLIAQYLVEANGDVSVAINNYFARH